MATTSENLFKCELTPQQEEVMFTPKVGNQPTYGLVESQAQWERERNERQPPGGIQPDIGEIHQINRKVFTSGKLRMPDNEVITHWGFEDDAGIRDFPSTPIVLSGGDLLQCTLHGATRQHTIHWHGIEPDSHNDGVGHTSWEVTGKYTYQWRAHPDNAGSYFYHCHVNTALHVQMGMFGALVLRPTGTRESDEFKLPFHDAPADWAFNHEYYWPFYAVDPRWHKLSHAAGVCGEDVGLNRFEPQYFLMGRFPQDPSGTPITGDAPDAPPVVSDPDVGQRNRQPIAVRMSVGDQVLIRMVNATYFPVDVDFGQLNAEVRCIETDGRALRNSIDFTGRGVGTRTVSQPWSARDGRFSPAQRHAVLFRPTKRGTFPVTATYRHWITNKVVGVVRTTITVD